MQYGTSRKFLDIFGLRNLKELPSLAEIEELLPDGIGEEEDDEVLADITDHLAEEATSTYSEGQEELEKIVDQINSIDTSTEFFEQEKQRQRDKRDRDRAANLREALDLGELVEDKDMKWLKRYEEKLAEIEAEKVAQEEALASDKSDDPILDVNNIEKNQFDEISEEIHAQPTDGVDQAFMGEPESTFSDEIQALSEETFQDKQLLPDDEQEELSVVNIEEALFAEDTEEPIETLDTDDSLDESSLQLMTESGETDGSEGEEDTSDEELDQFLGLGEDKDNPSD